jgi:hypothetical protein
MAIGALELLREMQDKISTLNTDQVPLMHWKAYNYSRGQSILLKKLKRGNLDAGGYRGLGR